MPTLPSVRTPARAQPSTSRVAVVLPSLRQSTTSRNSPSLPPSEHTYSAVGSLELVAMPSGSPGSADHAEPVTPSRPPSPGGP